MNESESNFFQISSLKKKFFFFFFFRISWIQFGRRTAYGRLLLRPGIHFFWSRHRDFWLLTFEFLFLGFLSNPHIQSSWKFEDNIFGLGKFCVFLEYIILGFGFIFMNKFFLYSLGGRYYLPISLCAPMKWSNYFSQK